MKICRRISDQKFIEMQSFATPGTLISNAVNAGYNARDIEELDITNAQWEVIRAGLNPETPTQARERKINTEMKRMAEQSLIDRGEL